MRALACLLVVAGCGGESAGIPDAAPPRPPEFVIQPSLTANEIVPLAPRLTFTTDVPTQARVELGDGVTVELPGYAAAHDVPLLGLKPGRSYRVTVKAHTSDASASAAPIDFTTDALPENFPPIRVTVSDRARMEPGVTIASVFPRRAEETGPLRSWLIGVDEAGDVVWYYGTREHIGDARRTSRGTLLYVDREIGAIEIDMAGTLVRRWQAAAVEPAPEGVIAVDIDSVHHECFEMASGNLLALSSELRRYESWPRSEDDPSAPFAPSNVVGDRIVELRLDGTVVGSWSLLDVLDPMRIGYNSLNGFWNDHYGMANRPTRDWSHANAVVHDPSDDSLVISVRHQDAVVKIDRGTGALKWILGTHDNWRAPWSELLLAPQGGMEWPYHTHGAKVLANGNVLLFDNGTFRASPPEPKLAATENYSRAVEYRVDAAAKTVTEVWSYGGAGSSDRFYSAFLSDADLMPQTGNVLITDGGRVVDEEGQPSDDLTGGHRFARLVEVTHTQPATKVWEVYFGDTSPDAPVGWMIYRSMRLPGLYP